MSEVIHNIEVEADAKFKEVWSVIEDWFERLKGHGQFASAQVHQALDDQKAHLAAAVATVLPEGTSLGDKPVESAPLAAGSLGGVSAPPIEAVINQPLTTGASHEG